MVPRTHAYLARASRDALCLVLLLSTGSSAAQWCDLPFKDVAAVAQAVVLARYREGPQATFVVEEVLKGQCEHQTVAIDPEEVSRYRPRDADQFLLALGPDFHAIQFIRGMGACGAVSILPIHAGNLRARFRGDYDGQREALTLDQIRSELNPP